MTVGAIIVAAGSSTRMEGGDKLQREVGGRPVLQHSIETFAGHARIDRLIAVASAANMAWVRGLTAAYPRFVVVEGGARRRDSVMNGLDAVEDCDIVVVHDGARPLVSARLIDAAIQGAMEHGACLCAVRVTDTVKRAEASGLVRSTISREGLWLAQTPQAFRVDVLRQAHRAHDIDATDDAALVELIGLPVGIVEGSRENIKVTTPEDLMLAEALLDARRRYTAT